MCDVGAVIRNSVEKQCMTVAAKDKENKEVTMLELLFCPCWCAVCTAIARMPTDLEQMTKAKIFSNLCASYHILTMS